MNGFDLKISGYEVRELIHESDRTLVYRGQKLDDRQSAILKLMRNEYPSFNELVQFRNQYAITKNLDIEGIVKPIALERYQNRYALIMEDFGGIALSVISHPSPVTRSSIAEFLNIAIQLADILHQLHQNHVIHKDIKPANILIHPETNQVKLIDFSISTLLPKETQTIQTPNVLEGTLAYISPEQTGRMNRGIDYRSDFYSLGVTFYELLTGKLPFESDDPLELIHAHIAKPPSPTLCLGARSHPPFSSPLSKGGMGGMPGSHRHSLLPTPLADIVMKLMAKNAEDRYQSGLGLKCDLEKCLSQWQETGKIEPFDLGERDLCDRFLIPDKLYGREQEVNALLAAFERVSGEGASGAREVSGANNLLTSPSSHAELFLVAGYSGVGKTAVVNEVHKPIVEKRGYFIKGKFDQFQRNIPFSAFVQAFRDLMGQLLGESDAQLQRWKDKILAALGDNGRVIIEVIPELERIIGEQPPVPELEGSAVQNRFNLLFEKFVRVFATREHPLVIFIDDLQWVDSASLSLLKLLMGEAKSQYLLAIGAYRDNEVFPAHPLMLTLKAIEKTTATLKQITLQPLEKSALNQWVADSLSCGLDLAQPLTDLIFQKTKGNPFFATQFLKGLHEDGLITFDGEARYWQCDIGRVRELSLTDDVVEFMTGRLQKLSRETRERLKLAACLGNQFDLETLAIASQQSPEETAASLWEALKEGLILPQSETYKFYQDSSTDVACNIPTSFLPHYKFLHDRVQQAAYALIPDDRKKRTHFAIGQLLLNNIAPSDRDVRIFDIVNHLNQGQEFIQDAEKRLQLVRLNLTAGQKAKQGTAYQAAFDYLSAGLALLPEQKWERHYELTLQEEALANELAAKFYWAWGREKMACTYMQEAYYGYSRWGAKA
ncbi:MAG: AAA family ATPase, partial [Spirulina sp.]